MARGQGAPRPLRDEAVVLTGLIALLAITAAWWALALWPVHVPAEWLVRTRSACFGTDATGLPDAAGWIGLIGGPLGMLVILLAGWGRGVPALLRRAEASRALQATLLTLAIATLLLVTGAVLRVRAAQAQVARVDPLAGDASQPATVRLDRAAPPLGLVAHDGSTPTLASFRGRPVLVTFAYSHCTTVCPLVAREVLAAQSALRGTGAEPAVLIVTLDPWRDTPSRLASLPTRRALMLPDDAWILGGAPASVEAMLDAWQVPRTRDLRTGDVTHPALVYVLDPDGRIAHAAIGGGMEALLQLVRSVAPAERVTRAADAGRGR